MKIDNIIDDIKQDIVTLKNTLEKRLKEEYPAVNFSMALPGLEELAPIKLIALWIEQGRDKYYISVNIHTHNGNRVYLKEFNKVTDNEVIPIESVHPFQDNFVRMLRDVIKKNKTKCR